MDGLRVHGRGDGRIVVDVERRATLLVLVKQEEGKRGIRVFRVIRVVGIVGIVGMLRLIMAIGIT